MEKKKADFRIEGKNEIKIYGITFTNRPEQKPKKDWGKLASQTRSLSFFSYSAVISY